jgi:14-3-3 protein epsilon
MSAEEIEDLCFFCTLYQHLKREKEGIDAVHELIAIDPVFDRQRRGLFQAVYKLVIDPLRSSLRVLSEYQELEAGRGRGDHAALLAAKRDRALRQLLSHSKDAIAAIDSALLPNAGDARAAVFFHKLKGDFYRYMAEYADETDAVAAGNAAEEAYAAALAVAGQALQDCDPVRLALVLNAAIFKCDIRKDTGTAAEMLEGAIAACERKPPDLPEEARAEAEELIRFMKQNLMAWGDGRARLADE